MPETTTAQVKSTFNALVAISEAIREAGRVPSGTLYAILCGRMDFRTYESLIRTLKHAGLVEEKYNELRWIGPEILSR
jgi:hypothetical protein